jgi:tetratricopeptide (TPR) repeat protein
MRRAALVLLAFAAAGCVGTGGAVNSRFLEEAEKEYLAGHFAQAAGHYEAYLADNPMDPRRAEIRLMAGKCHLGAGALEPAVASFDKALVAEPAPPVRVEILFRRAVACRLAGQADASLEGFRSVGASPDRDRAIQADEFRYEWAQAFFRAGEWKAGQAQLAAVSPNGPYGAKARARLGLSAFTVQVGSFDSEPQARAEAARVPTGAVRPVQTDVLRHTVTSGSFARYDDAQREAERLRKAGFRDAFVIP